MKTRGMFLLGVLFVFFALIFTQQPSAAPYYEGKVITIIVGYAPGGGFDRMARLVAKHLPKHVPGNPSIVIQNMPGASSMIAANHLYNLAKPDGLTIGIQNRGLIVAQLTKAEGVRFDFRKFAWLGSMAVNTSVLSVRTDLPVKTFEDVRKAKVPLNVAGSGKGDASTQFLILLKEFLGANVKLIVYPSTADMFLAVERKELDGMTGAYTSVKPYIDRGLLRPVIRGKFPEPGIEQLPVNEDLTSDSKAKTLMGMLSAADPLGRPFCAPPATSADLLGILREAFRKVAEDPELRADSEKALMPVQYLPPDECLKLINFILDQPPEIIREFSKYVSF